MSKFPEKTIAAFPSEDSPDLIAKIIFPENRPPFLSLCGTKLGGNRLAGGIPFYNFNSLDSFLELLSNIHYLDPSKDHHPRVVGCISDRTRLFNGATILHNGKWFYRIKGYRSGFVQKETGEWIPYKGFVFKPMGWRWYVAEFDIPITPEGCSSVESFKKLLFQNLQKILMIMLDNHEFSLSQLKEFKVLSNGDLPWLSSHKGSGIEVFNNSLFDAVCDFLMDEEADADILANNLNISPGLAKALVNVFSRYSPMFLEKGLVMDRFRSSHGNIHFQITQIPVSALKDSPCLEKLLDNTAENKWPAWKRVTFSSDQYSQGKRSSLEFAKYEVEAFSGAKEWGIRVNENNARCTSLRLFDLLRFYSGQTEEVKIVQELIEVFRGSLN